MKTTALLCAAGLTAAASAGQYTIGFERYTGYNDPVDPIAGLSMSVVVNESQGFVDFTLSLDAVDGRGTVKSIWFEEGLELADAVSVDEVGTVDLRLGRGKDNPGGIGALQWQGTEEHLGRKGNASKGIDAGESLTVRFDVGSDFFTDGLAALLAGESRIAFHLQRLGDNRCESAHFVSNGGTPTLTAVPLPSAGLLAGAGLGLVAGRRRSR